MKKFIHHQFLIGNQMLSFHRLHKIENLMQKKLLYSHLFSHNANFARIVSLNLLSYPTRLSHQTSLQLTSLLPKIFAWIIINTQNLIVNCQMALALLGDNINLPFVSNKIARNLNILNNLLLYNKYSKSNCELPNGTCSFGRQHKSSICFKQNCTKLKHSEQFTPSLAHIASFQHIVEQSGTENFAKEQIFNKLKQFNYNFTNIQTGLQHRTVMQ